MARTGPTTGPITVAQVCPPHHWLIAVANSGQRSQGVCRKCGESRMFVNVIDYSRYGSKTNGT